jgi:hypothetical protein
LKKNKALINYLIALAVGMAVGFRIIPSVAAGVFYLLGIAYCYLLAMQGKEDKFFTILPYLIYTEIFVRGFARWAPYLSMQYLYVGGFLLLLLNRKQERQQHSKAFVALFLFVVLEFLNGMFPNEPKLFRSTVIQSISLFMAVFYASNTILSPARINKIMYHVSLGSIYLAGIVFVAHLQGGIDYGGMSSSDASNGMAPVQLSAYLGTGAILFFFKIMNPSEKSGQILNVVALMFVAIIMVLTFSRGGLYFLGASIAIYFYYNRAQIGNYFKFIVLIPIIMFMYSIVVKETGGKIVERYEQKGASSREDLVAAGFKLFSIYPIVGVGTSNYNKAIVKEKFFWVESGAHNEFVRAAAEHGIFGILTHWTFFIVLLFEIFKRPQPQRQFALILFLLFFLITIHNGLKISLQPLIILLAVGITAQQKVNLLHVRNTKQQAA